MITQKYLQKIKNIFLGDTVAKLFPDLIFKINNSDIQECRYRRNFKDFKINTK